VSEINSQEGSLTAIKALEACLCDIKSWGIRQHPGELP
jgi:hypothetical protein